MDIIEDLRLNHEYCPKEVILAAADEIERLHNELSEMQELCDDLSSSVIAAASLAPHGNGAKDLLEEAMKRMAQRVRRKVSMTPNV